MKQHVVLKMAVFWALALAQAPLPACKSAEDAPEDPPKEVDPQVFIGCGNGGFWEVGTKASAPGSLEVKDSDTYTWSSVTSAGCSVVTTTAWCSPEVTGGEITWATPAGARLEVDGVCVQASTHGTALWDEATCPMSPMWTGCP